MRILVVSAHYPPNFVSGGTLAPQRQAQGLRRRGHDVSVYAGWLGEDRAPLSTWTEADDEGMDVRWVVTTPWVGWGDRANFDNPSVTTNFAAHLDDVRPDIVHLHSVQSLGGGLVSAAADAGARVVVTMHDFWWLCGRQFLVDAEYRPCSLVVSCGMCACQVDRSWLEARQAELNHHLERADAVLAVSQTAADVLVANGVDGARLRVDENGVPEADPSRRDAVARTAPTTDGLRLAYAGGHDRMKGVHVLLEAARRMKDQPGWRLKAYGVQPFLDEIGGGVEDLPVDVGPPFDPADIESVFAATDVLVVPSVMRETYSLITREALTRGVPVVCTDTLGPEEVVNDGVNGLIVPAGDPDALAGALARLLDEDDLLGRLRRGCAAVPVRSMADQLDGLETLYLDLASSAPTKVEARRAGDRVREVRTVLFLVGIEGAPLRYRARLPAEGLALHGVRSEVRHYRDPSAPELAGAADALVVYRVPATDQVLDVIARVRNRGTPVFFDVDDLIFDPDLCAEIPALAILEGAEAELWIEGVRRYRTTMEACDVFIGSTEMLCRHAETVVGLPAARFANGVGIVLAQSADAALRRPRTPGPVRIGYLSGTDTHDHDWRMIEPVVAAVLAEQPDVELWLGGLLRTSPALDIFGERVRRLPFLPWLELPCVLRDLDVNLAPLEAGSRFNEAKSAIKWLEAGLTATPTIASPTEAFREAIESGNNGMLAHTPDDWAGALRSLIGDPGQRARLGQRARRDSLVGWSPHVQGARYLEILERKWPARTSPEPADRWRPVSHDEPAMPVLLEAYGEVPALESPAGEPAATTTRQRLFQVRNLAGRGIRSLERDGVRTTSVRALRFGRRNWPRVKVRLKATASSARSRVRTIRHRNHP